MPITPTHLTVTPTWESKRLTVAGDASVRESVALTIAGCGADTSVVFKILSENGKVEYAKFPLAATDSWTTDGTDLTATLNLNTDLLVAAFADWGPDDRIDFVFTVASAADSNLYAKGHKQLGNWMEDVDDPVAYSTPIKDDLDALEVVVGDLGDDFTAHLHDGTADGGQKVPHGNLLGIGVNTHDAIDAALVTLTSGVSTNASNVTAVAGRVTVLENAATEALFHSAFSAVDELAASATGKQILAKVNAILTILKG